MRQLLDFTVVENRELAQDTYLLSLAGDTSALAAPGQFVNLEIPGYYLRRPLSVFDWAPGRLDLIYKVLGEGTRDLVQVRVGTTLSVLSGLGNGFHAAPAQHPLIVGGGVGVVPLWALARTLIEEGQSPTVIYGFNSAAEVILVEETEALGARVLVTTADGSVGTAGFVTAALDQVPTADYLYACGPTPMLRALTAATALPGQFSLEERMACGFGACVGCVVSTRSGMSRVCKEGPVFTREELQW